MQDKVYFQRCFDLAELGNSQVRPNPKVGSVIVFEDRIIGEGYHKLAGSNHAEVNAVNSVRDKDKHLIEKSTIYISLEPCHHYGATPPCVDLIINHNIPKIRIALPDPTEKVYFKSIEKLKSIGRDVIISEHSSQAEELIAEFKAINIKKRPFIQLKLAKSTDNFIGQENGQVHLTNQYTNVFTHKLRAYTDAILIGTNTALIDNPSLTLRNFPGLQPIRIVLDRAEKLPKDITILSDENPTIVVTEKQDYKVSNTVSLIILDFNSENFTTNLCKELIKLKIYHLMVEGGAMLIKSFMKEQIWDEAIVINTSIKLHEGIKAPNINGHLTNSITIDDNIVHIVKNYNR